MKLLKKNKLNILINKPARDVFSFLLDPVNTPRWVPSVVEEAVSQWPPAEGTVYRNKNREGVWNEYAVTSIEADKSFIFRSQDGNYHVRYTLTPASGTATDMEYYEWMIRGTIPEPFTLAVLERLKLLIESS